VERELLEDHKSKVVPVLLSERHAMKVYWESGGTAPLILEVGTRRSEWSTSGPDRFTSRERIPGTHWIRSSVGPRAGLDAVLKKNTQPLPGLEPPIIQPVA
jgi:hypothetical protein